MFEMINDVTTTPSSPPQFEKLILDSKAKIFGAKNIEPRRLKSESSLDESFGKIKTIAEEFGWKIELENKQDLKIEAVATTSFFKFKDDIVVEIRRESPPRVHMRSRSRLGKSDLGANAKRIAKFFEELEQQGIIAK